MIYINGRFLTQPLAGVNRFAYELTRALIDIGVQITIICPRQVINTTYDIWGFNIIRYGYGKSHIWEQLSLPFFFIGKRNYVLVNFTGLGPVVVFNKVITIHDLAFLENPSWYKKSYVLLYKFLTPISAKTSKHILTVSNFSKKEIINKIRIREDCISVIYNAANICEIEQTGILDRIPSEYILAVSSIDPRKNFERLISVFSQHSNYNLVVVGGGYHTFGEVDITTNKKNIFFLGRVSDAELASLYKNATAFIYPSLYEGFGIPPIEAMSYGCPAVVSDIDVLHEVCGDAVLYVNPYDTNDMAKTIETISTKAELRAELIEKGYKNIMNFNWHKSSNTLKHILGQFVDL